MSAADPAEGAASHLDPDDFRAAPDVAPASVRYRAHGHLWALWDGTPAHAPPGRLTHDAAGRIACHLCGEWFVHLGAHLRRHGWTAARYRAAVGLAGHAPLCTTELSSTIARRQQYRWRSDETARGHLETGIGMARSGELARRSADARHATPASNPALAERRRAALAAGRAARRSQAQLRVDELVRRAGAADLAELLRGEYAAGASIDALRRLTGMGRAGLRAELAAAAIPIRPVGHNADSARRRRADDIDGRVERRLGITDVRAWLCEQHAGGVPITQLADRTGRSAKWVRARLDGTTTTVHRRSS